MTPTATTVAGAPAPVKAQCARRTRSTVNPLPYAAVPHELTADLRLKAIDVRLANVLLKYAQSKATCWPSVQRLAEDLGRKERTVQYALRRLKAADWIDFVKTKRNPTGRLIVLTWRRCTRSGVQPYSQGLPRSCVQGVAPEKDDSENKKVAALPQNQESPAPVASQEDEAVQTAYDAIPEPQRAAIETRLKTTQPWLNGHLRTLRAVVVEEWRQAEANPGPIAEAAACALGGVPAVPAPERPNRPVRGAPPPSPPLPGLAAARPASAASQAPARGGFRDRVEVG